MKTPNHPDDPKRTLDFLDFPQMVAERFGVHWVEPYHTHLQSTETAYFNAIKDVVGQSHVHYAPERWSLPDAIAISREVGYKGLYAIDARSVTERIHTRERKRFWTRS